MRKWIKASVTTAFLTAGLFAFGMGAAHADMASSGDGSIAGGNQIIGDVNVPINVSGNSVGVLGGAANAESSGSGATADDGDDSQETSGDGSILGGNQVIGDVNVPINVCGNAVAVVGVANASCIDGNASVN